MGKIKMCSIKISIDAILEFPHRGSIIFMLHPKGSLHLTSELTCYFNFV